MAVRLLEAPFNRYSQLLKAFYDYYRCAFFQFFGELRAPDSVLFTRRPQEGRRVTLIATIQTIDEKKQIVTLMTEAKTVTVKAANPTNFEKVKVGDEVEITYTEALAISVETAKKE